MNLIYKFMIFAIKALLWLVDKDHRIKEEISMDDIKKFTHMEDVNFKSDYGTASKALRTVPYELWLLKTENHELLAADKHRVVNHNNDTVWIEDLSVGDLIKTTSGLESVVDIRPLYIKTHMYDIQVNTADENDINNHLFYSNGILSHNTTVAGSYLLWYAMFNNDKTILICANKLSQAQEILHRIKYAYEECPEFLKAGCKEFNKLSVSFDNGSRCICRATTADSGRGLSISLLYCLEGDNEAVVRDVNTGEVKMVSLETLYDDLKIDDSEALSEI